MPKPPCSALVAVPTLFFLTSCTNPPTQDSSHETTVRTDAAKHQSPATEPQEPPYLAVLGTWTTRHIGINITTTIFQEYGEWYMHQRFADGSVLREPLSRIESGLLSDEVEYYIGSPDANVGQSIAKHNMAHFVVKKNGRLELRDMDGRIWSARPVR